MEGAACHGCLYVAEPSYERFNGYLDWALVVPTMGLKESRLLLRSWQELCGSHCGIAFVDAEGDDYHPSINSETIGLLRTSWGGIG